MTSVFVSFVAMIIIIIRFALVFFFQISRVARPRDAVEDERSVIFTKRYPCNYNNFFRPC